MDPSFLLNETQTKPTIVSMDRKSAFVAVKSPSGQDAPPVELQPTQVGLQMAVGLAATTTINKNKTSKNKTIDISASSESFPLVEKQAALVKAFLEKDVRHDDPEIKAVEHGFTKILGDPLPWVRPNISSSRDETKQLEELIPPASDQWDNRCAICCCATVACAPYVCCKMHLVHKDQRVFSNNQGHTKLLRTGWNVLMSCWNQVTHTFPTNATEIKSGQVTLKRVFPGQMGCACFNSQYYLLLPGTHVWMDPLKSIKGTVDMDLPETTFGPLKFFTVETGFARVGYYNGTAIPFEAGRYAVNSPMFVLGPQVDVRQENVKFTEHQVMLDGGVSLKCEGLLTYQIVDVISLVKNMGVDDYERALQDMTKAELAKVFAAISLEQLSGMSTSEILQLPKDQKYQKDQKHGSQGQAPQSQGQTQQEPHMMREENLQAEQHRMVRESICKTVLQDISKFAEDWGIKIVSFQLESTKISDRNFASQYESATLNIAKAKATLKSNAADNLVVIQQAKAQAQAVVIAAESSKRARIIQAEATAESMRIESEARENAAKMMKNPFGQQLALTQEHGRVVGNLKATTLVMGANSSGSQNNAMFASLLPTLPTVLANYENPAPVTAANPIASTVARGDASAAMPWPFAGSTDSAHASTPLVVSPPLSVFEV